MVGKGWQFDYVPNTLGAVNLRDADGFSGQALQDIAAGRYDAPGHLAQAKRLSRQVLSPQLDGVPLRTRQILIALQKL